MSGVVYNDQNANAIQDATGASLTALPFTPEKVLAALDAKLVDKRGRS